MTIKHDSIARMIAVVLMALVVTTPTIAEEPSRAVGAVFNGSYSVGQKFGVTNLNDQPLHQFGMGLDFHVRYAKPAFGKMKLALGPVFAWANGRKSSVAEAYDAAENPYLQAQVVGSHNLMAGGSLGLDLGGDKGMVISIEGLLGPKWVTMQEIGVDTSKAPSVTRFTTVGGRVGLAFQMGLMKLGQANLILKAGLAYGFGSATPILEQAGTGQGFWSFHGHSLLVNVGAGFEM